MSGRVEWRVSPLGVVLAGGASRRMGRDKALLRLPDGMTLLERTVGVVRDAGIADVAVSVSSSERAEELGRSQSAPNRTAVVVDEYADQGPLAGLHAALRAYPGRHVVLVACDMPRLDARALRLLIDMAPPFDIVVPRLGGYAHPLHAAYSPACLPVIKRLLMAGRLAMSDLLAAPLDGVAALAIRVLDADDFARVGAPATSVANINTPVDLATLLGRDD